MVGNPAHRVHPILLNTDSGKLCCTPSRGGISIHVGTEVGGDEGGADGLAVLGVTVG